VCVRVDTSREIKEKFGSAVSAFHGSDSATGKKYIPLISTNCTSLLEHRLSVQPLTNKPPRACTRDKGTLGIGTLTGYQNGVRTTPNLLLLSRNGLMQVSRSLNEPTQSQGTKMVAAKELVIPKSKWIVD
jgi:hypothetical protein